MRKLRMLSLCAGIGGADLAAEWTGSIEVVGQVEIDDFCKAVLAKHWPDVKRTDDIKEVVGDEFGAIDLVVGGIPCQPFSNAGEQRGKEDDRYLWPEMLRIVKQARPSWIVLENVDDLTYMALDDIATDLESAEYAVQAFVLPACAVDAPHERQRCFVVAHANSERPQIRHRRSTQGRPRAIAERRGAGKAQPRVGRSPDGLRPGLDGHRWPALRGQAQHDREPTRTIEGKTAYRRNRLKALGNAIVPQQIYPILQCIVACEEGGDATW